MRIVLMVAFASGMLPASMRAQELGLELRAGQVTDHRGEAQPGATLAPSFAWIGESTALAVGGETTVPFSGGMTGTAGVRFRAWSAGRGAGVALSVEGAGSGATGGFRSFGASLSPRAVYARRNWSVAAGPHVGFGARSASAAGAASDLGRLLGRRAAAGMDVQGVYGAVAEVRAGLGHLRWSGAWRTSRVADTRWTDLHGEVLLEAERLAMALEAGVRTGAISEQWAGVRTAVQLRPGLALVARAGRHAADPLSGWTGGTRAEIGVRLSTGGSSSTGRRIPAAPAALMDGATRLVLRAEPDAKVELVGDWTDWKPIPVEESEPGVYGIAVLLPPGTHRFAFVVDGVWRTPAGYATEADGYGGRHAVVRIAGR